MLEDRMKVGFVVPSMQTFIHESINQSINQYTYLANRYICFVHSNCARAKVPKQTLWGARARAGTKLKRFFFLAWKETHWVSIAICVHIIVQIYIYIIYIYRNTHLDILHMHMYIYDLLQPLGLAWRPRFGPEVARCLQSSDTAGFVCHSWAGLSCENGGIMVM